MSDQPTIDEVKAIQRRLGLRDTHVCWIGPTGFVIAHTDEERETIDLVDCDLHVWLSGHREPPVHSRGYHIAFRHECDLYSEPYGADPWDFEPLAAEL